jgi:hypothetical protein
MQCFFLFRDARGRLPSVGELMARGFVISAAVEPSAAGASPRGGDIALAAETSSEYGDTPGKKTGEAPEDPAGQD